MRTLLKEYSLASSLALFLAGLAMLSFGILWYLSYIQKAIFQAENSVLGKAVGDWGWWILIPGFFVFLAGVWYFGDQLLKRKKFKTLLSTTSKASFVRSLPELEELTLGLPRKYKEQIKQKKLGFRL